MGVSVNYRLAPHTPYPGPLMDCYAALTYVHDHGPELGIDPSLIGLHGVNAGGGLAAALAVVARDHGDIPVAFQLLDSPMLDDRQKTASSLLDSPTWTAASTEHGWRSYLGDLYGTADLPIYAAAARCTKLRRLPPAFISVGSLDGFLDEAVDYASRLNHDGVVTELHVYPGAPHGYQLARGSDVARRAERDKVDWLRRQISRP
jgi:acetyl esterase/lipase